MYLDSEEIECHFKGFRHTTCICEQPGDFLSVPRDNKSEKYIRNKSTGSGSKKSIVRHNHNVRNYVEERGAKITLRKQIGFLVHCKGIGDYC